MLRQERAQPRDDGALALDVDGARALERNAFGEHLRRRMGQVSRGVHDVHGITQRSRRESRMPVPAAATKQ